MRIPILLRHNDFIVVDKPPGVLVHSHSRFPNEKPMVQRVRDQLGQYVWPIHRLDRQTSGCLIMATRKTSVEPLSIALSKGTKEYLAMVRGHVRQREPIEITTPIKVNQSSYKDAHSTAYFLAGCSSPRSSIIRVQTHTGRHHQVRRHLRDINHPILHDGDHGDSHINRWWREKRGLKRLALHACRVSFTHQNITIEVESYLPKDLTSVFCQTSWWNSAVNRYPTLDKNLHV